MYNAVGIEDENINLEQTRKIFQKSILATRLSSLLKLTLIEHKAQQIFH